MLASSSSVYGSAPGGSSRVSDLPVPVSPYGVSKLAAERLALAYGARTGVPFDVLALRYFTVYGPRQRSTMLMARILDAAFTQQPMTLFGDGSQRRHFTFVGDAVAATVMAGTCSLADSIVVNVAGRGVSQSAMSSPLPNRPPVERSRCVLRRIAPETWRPLKPIFSSRVQYWAMSHVLTWVRESPVTGIGTSGQVAGRPRHGGLWP